MISCVVFSFFFSTGTRDGKYGQCLGSITVLGIIASRIHFLIHSGLRVDSNVGKVRKELLQIPDCFDSLDLFRVKLLALKISFDPPAAAPGFYFKLNRRAVTGIVAAISTCSGVLFGELIKNGAANNPSTFGILTTILVWNTATVFHNAICIWYNFIQHLYASYFLVVALELKEINAKWSTLVKQDLEKNLNACLQVFSILEELVLTFNQDFSVGIISDIGYSFISSIVFSFFFCTLARDGKSEQCFGMGFLLFVIASRIYYFAEGGLRVYLNVGAVRKELLLVKDGFDSHTLFKAKLLALKISLDPPLIAPGFYFKLDRRAVSGIVAALSTYILILFQFRQDEI
ncbi:unnamed protein product [Allacma fusca]|uniref:Uncharacterized protein n=1 Tax=Allacma fusca TaxID=39272 RepID=A0A8J2K1L0_9HEXA|nr:unnamed protein product [Allacma fusca]